MELEIEELGLQRQHMIPPTFYLTNLLPDQPARLPACSPARSMELTPCRLIHQSPYSKPFETQTD